MTAIRYAADYNGASGDEMIQAAIDDSAAGRAVVVIGSDGPDEDGRWDLKRAIEIPSFTTVLLQGAHLRLVDGADDNIIRNRNLEDGDREIHIIGEGSAMLDGNARHQQRDWDELYWSYGVHLFNVESCSVRGVTIGPTNCWALTIEDACDIRVSDIEFAQEGETPNQDGFHLLGPASRVVVNGITGSCGDDVVAVDTAESSVFGRGEDGPITGVAVTNVAVENRHSTGLFRTIADRQSSLDGVYAGNLLMTGDTSVGDAVLKIGWSGSGIDDLPRPANHRNITVENVFVDRWDGPYCDVEAPVKNLTLRGCRGRHTGPFFYTFGHDVTGMVIEDCRTTLTGNPPSTLVSDYVRERMTENVEVFDDYDALPLERPPGMLDLGEASFDDVSIMDSTFVTDVPDASATTAIRVSDATTVDGLTLRNVALKGFDCGVKVDGGAVRNAISRGVRQTDVTEPWTVSDAVTIHGDDNAPPITVESREVTLGAGDRRRIRFPDAGSCQRSFDIELLPLAPTDGMHAYRVDGVGADEKGTFVLVRETGEEAGGSVRIEVTVG
jgi:hypothetical protein